MCTFCKASEKTIVHLFYECEHTKQFLLSLKEFIENKCSHISELNCSKHDILFGITNTVKVDTILNFIILIAKRYIYTSRYKNLPLNITNFKNNLKFYYNIEKNVQYSQCNWKAFKKRWLLYEELVKD